MTKDEAIEKLLDDVHGWDVKMLIEYVRDDLRGTYEQMGVKDLESLLDDSGLLGEGESVDG